MTTPHMVRDNTASPEEVARFVTETNEVWSEDAIDSILASLGAEVDWYENITETLRSAVGESDQTDAYFPGPPLATFDAAHAWKLHRSATLLRAYVQALAEVADNVDKAAEAGYINYLETLRDDDMKAAA